MTARDSAWRREADDLLRGVAGGMLLGIPLLYTVEVWWRGSELRALGSSLMLVATFVPVVALIATSGFRRSTDVGWIRIGADAIEAVAVAAACVLVSVLVIGAVDLDDPPRLTIGTVVAELGPFAIGVALASVVLGATQGRGGDNADAGAAGDAAETNAPADGEPPDGEPPADGEPPDGELRGTGVNRTVADLGGALVGAVVVGLSIAPTDEVPLVAAGRSPAGLLLVVGFSLVVSYVIVFAAGFGDQGERAAHEGVFQQPVTETVASYLLALIAGAVMLGFFGRIRFDDPARLIIEQVVVLGLPTCIGGAAGRLAV